MGDEPTKENGTAEVLEESVENTEGSSHFEKKRSSKKRVAAIAAACALVLVVGCGSVFAMSQRGSEDNLTADSPAQSTNTATSQKATNKKDTAEATEGGNKASDATDEAQPATTEDSQPGVEDAQSAATESNQTSGATRANAESAAPIPAATHTHNWVEQTSTQWVPNIVTITDSAAWDESVPVYSTKECAICYTCGADISSNITAHQEAHALAGEGAAYSVKNVQTITGYETIHHDAVTHTEDQGHEQTTMTGYVCSECGAAQ